MKKVITYGTFDLMHQGHINLLKNARKLGDYLIVGVTSESYDSFRGKLNVKQSLVERIENVKATGLADEILVEEYEGQKIDDILRLGVDVFAIGSDWVGKFDYLGDYCQIVYLPRTKGISSTELRQQNHDIIHFGIIGNGRIAGRFVVESKYVSGCTVDAVYNPNIISAQKFSEKHELSFYTDDLDELLNRVNAVYICSPHETHYDYTKKALLQGHSVICEKPLALSVAECEELYALADKMGVVLMEAIKTEYCPGFQRLVSCAKSGKIGRIISVDAAFTKLVPPNVREMQDNGFGGSMLELASYPVLAVVRFLGINYSTLNFTSYYQKNNVDLFTKIDFVYPNAVASAKVGLGVKTEGSLVVSGTRGYIYVPAPWWKTEYFEIRYEDPSENEKYFFKFLGDGLRYEIMEFVNQIVNGASNQRSKEISCAISAVIEQYRGGNYLTKIEGRANND